MELSKDLGILVFGIPGSGKTSLAIRLAEQFQAKHLSASAVLRDYRASHADDCDWERHWRAGRNAPDEEVLPVLWNAYRACWPDHVVLDGYPRTSNQLRDFYDRGGRIIAAIWLKLDRQAARQRIAQRLLEVGRVDDIDEVIEKRIVSEEHNSKELASDQLIASLLIPIDVSNMALDDVCMNVTEHIRPRL